MPVANFSPEDYFRFAAEGWTLCLDPCESLTEKLAASLFEWKSEGWHGKTPAAPAFSVFLREETAQGWVDVPVAQTRLVPKAGTRGGESFRFPILAHSPLRVNCCASFSRDGTLTQLTGETP